MAKRKTPKKSSTPRKKLKKGQYEVVVKAAKRHALGLTIGDVESVPEIDHTKAASKLCLTSIDVDSLAKKECDTLSVNDIVVEVNGVDVREMSYAEARNVIVDASRPISLVCQSVVVAMKKSAKKTAKKSAKKAPKAKKSAKKAKKSPATSVTAASSSTGVISATHAPQSGLDSLLQMAAFVAMLATMYFLLNQLYDGAAGSTTAASS